MKAILINPFNQTITEIKYSGNFKEIYKLIDCSTFDCINIDDDNTLFVDDEGLLKQNRYFYWKDYTNLAGKALIIGVDYQTGEDCETSWSLQQTENMVEWLPEGHEEEPMMEFITWN